MNRRFRNGFLSLVLLIVLIGSAISEPGFGAAGEREVALSFHDWLSVFRQDAMDSGIAEKTLEKAFAGLEPIPKVVELDRRQPEFTLSLEEYLRKVVSDARVDKGRALLRDNPVLFGKIGKQFGVEAPYLVALWGIETNYGEVEGGFPVIAALATLAYDGRRGAFFRQELLYALRILDSGSVVLEQMKGSWAGAMGQLQFLPSVFYRFAVDFNGDGKKDIWSNKEDCLASAANYLRGAGWRTGQPWGVAITLPADFDREQIGLHHARSVRQWQVAGVRINNRQTTPEPDLPASVIQPDGPAGRAFLVFENYRVILKWNRADAFACAVGLLADRIGMTSSL